MSVEDGLNEKETSEEVVNEDVDLEDDDVLAAEVEVPQGGGCSAGTWVIILLIVAALVYVGVWQVKKNASERAERDRVQRTEVRQTMLGEIAGDLNTVDTRLQQGDISGAIDALNQMDYKLAAVQTEASRATDVDDASRIGEMRRGITAATKDIETQYEALQQAAQSSLKSIRASMGVADPTPAVDGGEAAPTDVVPTDEPAAVEPPPAEETAVVPAPGEPAAPDAGQAPEAAPAEPVPAPAADPAPAPAPPAGPGVDSALAPQ